MKILNVRIKENKVIGKEFRYVDEYMKIVIDMIKNIRRTEIEKMKKATQLMAKTIMKDKLINVFGSGAIPIWQRKRYFTEQESEGALSGGKQMVKKFLILGYLLFFLTNSSIALSQELYNIALGRPYTMNPAPDYVSCIEAGDKIQLTDGEKRGSFWLIGSTVGWSKNKEGVELTIDLGWDREFDEIKVYSRTGSGVHVPEVEGFVSEKGKEFKKIGESYKVEEPKTFDWRGFSCTVSIPTPKAKGRYVRIVMKGKYFIFCDEIEILSSSPKLLEIKERKQERDGSYTYILTASPSIESTEVILQGCKPSGEILLKKSQKLNSRKEVKFSFSLPAELCHILLFDLKDNKGRVLERCLERINYSLPSSRIRPAQVINLEKGWSYQLRNPEEKPIETDWEELDLKERFCPFHPFYVKEKPQVIWYRKNFSLPSVKDRIIKLRLNRVRHAPCIYLNGKLVAEGDLEPNMPHTVVLTKFIKKGNNELLIKLYDWRALLVKGAGPLALERYGKFKKETWFALAPAVTNNEVASGKYTFIYPPGYGKERFGILDRVELLLLPKVYLQEVKIIPSVSKKRLTLEITLKNEDSKKHQVVLSNIIGDIKNPSIKKLPNKKIELSAFSTRKVYLEEKWGNPILWWPRDPHLYHLSTIVKEKNKILETRNSRFGFREITAEGSNLKLNEKKLHLFGVHHAGLLGNYSYASLKMLQEHSFNTYRTWGGSSGEELLKAADEMGFIIIDEGNTFSRYVNASQDFWDNCFSHFKRRVKRDYNHPSVIAYSTQNEYTLHSTPWAQSKWSKERMDELIQRMNKEDPSRLSGHEGSFNSIGNCSGSETILLPHYAAEARDRGPKSKEYLLPNYYYLWKENFKGTSWENRPVYIGEMGLGWDFRSNIPDASTIYNVGDRIYRNWRARRNHDPRVIAQFIPMEIDAMRYNQIVGVSPNSWGTSPEIVEICRSQFSPFYIQIKEYSHLFYGGERIKRRIVVYNDFLDGKGIKELKLLYELRDEENTLYEGEKSVVIEDGEKKEVEIMVSTPKVEERKEVELSLKLIYGNSIVFEKVKSYSIFPEISQLTSQKRIILYDRKGETSPFLKKWSLIYADSDFSKLNPLKDILIIGKNSLNEKVVKNKENIENFVKKGGVVISLSQEKNYQWLPIPVILDTSHPSTINYLRSTGHSILKGIKEDDLKFWGDDNLTTSANFKKPVLGGYRAIVDTAGIKGLLWSPLLEIPYYRGTYILCQFDLVDKFSSEPAAGLLFRNLLVYGNQKRKEPSRLALLKDTEEKTKGLLRSAGIGFDELASPPEKLATGYNLLLLGGEIKLGEEDKRRLKEFVKEGGIVILHHLTPSSSLLSLLPEKISLGTVNIDNPKKSVIHTDYTPLTYGMSNQVFYWLGKSPPGGTYSGPWPPSPEIADYQLKISKGSKAEVLLDPPLLVKFPSGKGYFLIDQINWEKASDSHKGKAKEYLRILFTNLGLTIKIRAIRAKSCFPIDIFSFCNMGFADEEAGDGKGGWTDQGENDLRAVPVGSVKFKGVSFTIIDPAENQGKSCIVLKSEHSPWGLEKIKGIKVGRKAPFLYFLHASAWTKAEEMAKYIINYQGGDKIEIPIIGKKNIGEWWKPISDLPEAEVAWEGPNPQAGNVGLWLFPWKNPFPEKVIETIDIESSKKTSISCLVAIGGEKGEKK